MSSFPFFLGVEAGLVFLSLLDLVILGDGGDGDESESSGAV